MGYRERILSYAPAWFQGPNMTTLLQAIGSEADARAEQVLRGRMAGIPYAGGDSSAQRVGASRLADGRLIECDPGVIPIHASDRGIRVYPTEPVLSQRVRVASWWWLHKRRGTHWGEIENVRPFFAGQVARGFAYPTIRICFQDNAATPCSSWYSVLPDGTRSLKKISPSNFDFDGRPTRRSRWWAFLEMQGTGFTSPYTYGDGDTYGDGIRYGEGSITPFTADMQADVVDAFDSWRAAASWLAGVVLVWNGTIDVTAAPVQDASGWWSLPNGKWGDVVDPATHLLTRPPYFEWIYDNPAP